MAAQLPQQGDVHQMHGTGGRRAVAAQQLLQLSTLQYAAVQLLLGRGNRTRSNVEQAGLAG